MKSRQEIRQELMDEDGFERPMSHRQIKLMTMNRIVEQYKSKIYDDKKLKLNRMMFDVIRAMLLNVDMYLGGGIAVSGGQTILMLSQMGILSFEENVKPKSVQRKMTHIIYNMFENKCLELVVGLVVTFADGRRYPVRFCSWDGLEHNIEYITFEKELLNMEKACIFYKKGDDWHIKQV